MNLSAREFHIYIEQGLQRQGGFKRDFQWDQAVDIALVQAQERVIRSKIAAKDDSDVFEINSKYTSDIEAIIVLDYPLFVSKDPNNSLRSIVVLPDNFDYLLGDGSLVVENCQTEFTTPTPTQTFTERAIILPFVNASSGPFFKSITLSVGNNSTILSYPGFITTDEKVFIVDYIVDAYKDLGVEAYWEDYKNIHKPNNFIIIVRDITTLATLQVDGVLSTPTNIDKTITGYINLDTVAKRAVNRDIKADYLRNALESNYHKPSPESPLVVMASGQLFIYMDERFLVSKIFIDYIRKPKRINLDLNQTSELSGTLHIEIADMAIRLLKKKIEDDTYQLEVQDTEKRVE